MHRFLSSMRQRLPSPKDPAVCYVPGDLFFIERVDIPSGLSESEADAYVQTALEGMSPFALDHLRGWVRVPGPGNTAFLYAALSEKVQPRLPEEMGSGVHVFPSFLPFLGMIPDRPVIRLRFVATLCPSFCLIGRLRCQWRFTPPPGRWDRTVKCVRCPPGYAARPWSAWMGSGSDIVFK